MRTVQQYVSFFLEKKVHHLKQRFQCQEVRDVKITYKVCTLQEETHRNNGQ